MLLVVYQYRLSSINVAAATVLTLVTKVVINILYFIIFMRLQPSLTFLYRL